MSKDPQFPKDQQSGRKSDQTPFREQNIEADLWNLDDDSLSPPEVPIVEHVPIVEEERENEQEAEEASPQHESIIEEQDLTTPVESIEEAAIEHEEASQAALTTQTIKGYFTSFSLLEKISFATIVLIMCLAALFSAIHFSKKIRIVPLIPEELELPVKGERFTITSVSTYWRKPVTTGANTDIIRRDTVLIPCVRMKLKGDSGAIRVFFYDHQKNLIGDTISRNINGETTIEIAATDGFKDMGMHSAYRAENTKRWSVSVFEGTSEVAPIGEFMNLFKTFISPNLE